jgi:hypothetical protein
MRTSPGGLTRARGRGAAAPAVPPVAGYAAWIDPSDAASIIASLNLASQISDKSGNAKHLTQATGSLQPLTNTATINGLNALRLDNADDTMLSAAVTIAQPLTIVTVLRLASAGSRHDIIHGGPSNPGLFAQLGTPNWDLFAGGVATSGIATDTSVHFIVAQYNGAASFVQVDGTQSAALNPGTNAISLIGFGPNGSGFGANVDQGETLWYPSGLIAPDIASLRSYYQSKWATP